MRDACKYGCLLLLLFPFLSGSGQVISTKIADAHQRFIENKGQYGHAVAGYTAMGQIVFGYEGFDMPVLFTTKGLVHLQRKIDGGEERGVEKKGRKGPDGEKEVRTATDRIITLQWLGANPNVQVVAEGRKQGYHTYGVLQAKAMAFDKIIYHELYPGIDLVYSLVPQKRGFEYSLRIKPGADVRKIKLLYGGDVRRMQLENNGRLSVQSDIDGVEATAPVCFYENEAARRLPISFVIEKNTVRFALPDSIDYHKTLVIDPFVSSTSNLTGANVGKAKDVDFDYAGNVYVSGGGDLNGHRLAKYDPAGNLLWTFSGSLTIPAWQFGPYYGGWVVEKNTGNVYLGQGFNFTQGFIVIRLSTTGLYDNYITTGNPNFRENWKMIWNCNTGSPQILVAGGGTNSNINLGLFAPPATTVTASNITGISPTAFQDMADMVIDPLNNQIYTLFASGSVPALNNAIYKHSQPYSAGTIAWNRPSGYNVLAEANNRPYLSTTLIDNSTNILAVNANYLFYWDGKNLKAINKATGTDIGTPVSFANAALVQGGIIADACNNVFIGTGNGVIKVYQFNGAVFDDAVAPDIALPGVTGTVYDLAYDEAKKLLYASGNGFVASADVSAYCPTTVYTVNVTPNCSNSSATATISPAPPVGSTVTYQLYLGTTLIATNTTGVFTALTPNITYTVVATINLACSGVQATTTFIIHAPLIAAVPTHTLCGASMGSITATGSGTTGPYTYSIDGTNFQGSGLFAGLAAGIYTVTVRDANNCINRISVTILNTDGPQLTATGTNANCGLNNGTITVNATGGSPPYQYSINNGISYQSNNFFTGLGAGTYTVTIRDANNCVNLTQVVITASGIPQISAIPAAATCGTNNGTITAFGTGGAAPLQYSINGNTYQSGNTFANLTPGTYTVYVKDANGCIRTVTVTVANNPAPTVTAVSTTAVCSNVNGSITATGNGGVAPLQYSINGTTFQASNVFTGLAAGTYTVTVRDFTGCTAITTVTVPGTGGPSVFANSTAASCGTANGSITISALGTAPFTYSLNGINFLASNLFTGLLAGNYIAYARDAAGCIGAVAIVVPNIAGPALTASTTASSCLVNDGTITAIGSGGTPPLEYSIDGTSYQTGNLFTGLAPGNYTVYVRDANNCVRTVTLVVANGTGLGLSVSSTLASCNTNNGTITANGSSGQPPLEYSLNGVTYQAANVFTGLAPGSYTVYVRDFNGCVVTRPITVVSAVNLSLSVSVPLHTSCNASNGVIAASGSGGAPPLQYSLNGTVYQSGGTFVGVAAGTYTVYVRDVNGCIATQQATVAASTGGPGISTFTVATEDAYPCNGSLGRITNPRVNGANCLTCTYSLNFGPYVPHATQLFLNLAAGTYAVTALDANGCTMTILATVSNAPLATATATVTASACSANTGSITLTGVGVNTPYHASITGIGGPFVTFDPTHTFTGLAPGAYTIIIADEEDFNAVNDPGNCLDTIQVLVPSIGGPTLSVTPTAGTCGQNNGSITAAGSGGVSPYTYNINGGTYQASGTFANLAVGTYLVGVRDFTNCVSIASVTITNGGAPSATATVVGAACNGSNGSITAAGAGGVGPLTYSINGFNFQSANQFTGLAAGNYTLYVKDSAGCYTTSSVNVPAIPRPTVTAFTVAATCNNNDGMVIANGSAGTPPYQYSLDGTVFQSGNSFAGLAAGIYTVTIKDARNCINTTMIALTNTGAPTFTTILTTATCGNATGSITVTASGGTTPYEYSRDGTTFQTGNVFNGLLPGTYTITVRDFNGCQSNRTVVVTSTNGPQVLTAVIVHAACGASNGSITATASGGTGALQYSLNGTVYQVSPVFTNLAAGSYTLYVRDALGCTRTLPVTLLNLPGPTLTVSPSPASCGRNDGAITVTATGGTGALQYSINGITFQTNNVFTGLAAGTYTVIVRDVRNCTSTAVAIITTIGSNLTPTFNPVSPICTGAALSALPTTSLNGVTGTWSPVLNNTATTTYTFTPNLGQCANPTTLTITVNPPMLPTFTAVPPVCAGTALTALPTVSTNGITGTWSPVLNNTTTTTYTFTPTTGQCAATATLTITITPKPAPIVISHN
jgi:large repetitive protein